jgi:transcriptional regulator GlxA family with amidase domain
MTFSDTRAEAAMRRIGFVLSPGFQVMSFAALSVFEFANKEMGEPVYDIRVLSETGGSMRSSIGCNASTKGSHKLARLGFRTKELLGGLDWCSLDGHPVMTSFEPGSLHVAAE